MKHFSTEEWIDFVNQVVPSAKKLEMQGHLGSGCKRCAKSVSAWQRVERAAKIEANYQPPTDQVRLAKAAFAGSLLTREQGRDRGFIEVLFDSFLQPILEGARSSNAGGRLMLYRAGPFQIDLQIEAQPGGGTVVVTGQLLNVENPGLTGSNLPIMFSNLRGGVVRAITNQFGEFRETIETSGDLELIFP